MARLKDKICLITGAARGQGAEEADLFIKEGGTVWLTDVLDEEGEATAKRIGGTYRHLDVRKLDEWQSLVKEMLATHSRIDVLINNAGIFRSNSMRNTPLEEYQLIMDINATGTFLGMQTVAVPMREAGSGSIVNISSLAGLQGAAGAFAYSTSKWAVRGMTKTAAIELGRRGVRVNSIHPGLIETDMMRQLPTEPERMARSVPLGRVAQSSEVAALALYLASDDSSYSTGSEFVVDGGLQAL